MNAVEIEQVGSNLAEHRFYATDFHYAFLTVLGNKETTFKRMHEGNCTGSDERGAL